MENTIMSIDDLIGFNEMMLGRGMPTQDDGVGYNKADYGACANYFYGMSDAQIADLAKRLVKYSKTQLKVDRQVMLDTAEHYASLVSDESREDGISLNITENGTMIAFKYNERFVKVIKDQPQRQYDGESKQWVVPNDKVIPVLNELGAIGADVENALQYALQAQLIKVHQIKKVEVKVLDDGDFTLLKFDYNKDILNVIKKIDYKDRQWNAGYKFWAIKKEHFDGLKKELSSIANFKIV